MTKEGIVMKKGIYFSFLFLLFSSVLFASPVPSQLQRQLMAKAWSGFLTTDFGADGYKQITLNFTQDESNKLTGMITIYGVQVGNGVFNPSEFLTIDYQPVNSMDGILSLSYLDPKTRLDRSTYTLKATYINEATHIISGLLYLTTVQGEIFKIGTFRVE